MYQLVPIVSLSHGIAERSVSVRQTENKEIPMANQLH